MNFWRIFLLYLPYRKCFLNADLTYPAEAATGVREIDKWPQREANECMPSATHNRQAVLVREYVSLCSTSSRDKRTQSQNLQNCLARRQWTLFCAVNLLCKILCIIIMPRRLSVTRYRYNPAQVLSDSEILCDELSDGDMFMYKDTKIFHIVGSSDGL